MICNKCAFYFDDSFCDSPAAQIFGSVPPIDNKCKFFVEITEGKTRKEVRTEMIKAWEEKIGVIKEFRLRQ